MKKFLLLVASVALLAAARAQEYQDESQYNYEYNYADSYGDLEDMYNYYDEYGYYNDDDDAYYEYYGYYADDFGGYEDDYYAYYDDDYAEEWYQNCDLGEDGKFTLHNGTASCDLKIAGADKNADQLSGGIDGVYKIVSCHNGKPLYRRKDSPSAQASANSALLFGVLLGPQTLAVPSLTPCFVFLASARCYGAPHVSNDGECSRCVWR